MKLPILLLVCSLGLLGCQPKEPVRKMDNLPPSTTKTKIGPPEFIILRGAQWHIVLGSHTFEDGTRIDDLLILHGPIAETYCEENTIAVRSGLPEGQQRDSVFHEILHAGACGKGTDDEQARFYNSETMKNHRGIERLSSFLTDTFHENPELEKYLIGG